MEVELRLVEVKESLKKVESGAFTLGTTLDSSLQDSPAVSVRVIRVNSGGGSRDDHGPFALSDRSCCFLFFSPLSKLYGFTYSIKQQPCLLPRRPPPRHHHHHPNPTTATSVPTQSTLRLR